MTHIIQFDKVTKQFPGQLALDDVSFSIEQGEIHALLGENGAGKSTLLNVLHGIFPPSSGRVLLEGHEVHFGSAREAIHAGIAKVHQEISLIPDMTVADNLLLACEPATFGILHRREMRTRTAELLGRLHCQFGPETPVRQLNVGQKQMLQIAKALLGEARVISFDEPTSSLSHREVDTLFEVMLDLNRQGITLLYISHKLDEVFRLCHRATILRDGTHQGTFALEGIEKPELIRRMVGRDVAMFATRQQPAQVQPEVVMKASGIKVTQDQEPVSFELHRGEILGFFGLVGAQRTETLEGVFGARPLLAGRITFLGRDGTARSPRDAIDQGLAMLPENRKEHGFVAELDNAHNIGLPSMRKFRIGPFQDERRQAKNALEQGERVKLKPNLPTFLTRNLSGGNQQKVILAKWLTTDAEVIIFDEPTKGIDVGAKAEIYHLMEGLVQQGKSIVMISSELPEVMGMSDRILVMRAGAIQAEFERADFSEEQILFAAVEGKSE